MKFANYLSFFFFFLRESLTLNLRVWIALSSCKKVSKHKLQEGYRREAFLGDMWLSTRDHSQTELLVTTFLNCRSFHFKTCNEYDIHLPKQRTQTKNPSQQLTFYTCSVLFVNKNYPNCCRFIIKKKKNPNYEWYLIFQYFIPFNILRKFFLHLI